jgi:hypothetical protein
MSSNDPDSRNSAATSDEEGAGLATNGMLGGPLDLPGDINNGNGVEPVSPEDTGAATGADADPGYASVRPTGGSIDRDTGA